MSERMNIVEDRADWLVDAIAMSTQNRMFLRGDPEEDAVATEAILLCSKQALAHVEAAYRARVVKLEAALAAAQQLIRDLGSPQAADRLGSEFGLTKMSDE
jgi:hypothetical protein